MRSKLLTGIMLGAGLISIQGCASQISELTQYLPREERTEEHKTVDSLIKHYFTPKAQKVLKTVGFYDGPALSAYTAVNFIGRTGSLITGNGWGPNIIIPAWQLQDEGIKTINHEYVHILDYYDREKTHEFIDHKKFKKEYQKFLEDKKYTPAKIVVTANTGSDKWFTKIFGIGEMSEELAYFAGVASKKPEAFPNYLKETLTKIFKREILFPKENSKGKKIKIKNP